MQKSVCQRGNIFSFVGWTGRPLRMPVSPGPILQPFARSQLPEGLRPIPPTPNLEQVGREIREKAASEDIMRADIGKWVTSKIASH